MEYAQLAVQNEELRKELNKRKRKSMYHSYCKYDRYTLRNTPMSQRAAYRAGLLDQPPCEECKRQETDKEKEDRLWKKMKYTTVKHFRYALPSIQTRLQCVPKQYRSSAHLYKLHCSHLTFNPPPWITNNTLIFPFYKNYLVYYNVAALGVLAPVNSIYQINFNHNYIQSDRIVPRKLQQMIYCQFTSCDTVFDTQLDHYANGSYSHHGSLYMMDKSVSLVFTTFHNWPFPNLLWNRFNTSNLQCDCRQSPSGQVVCKYIHNLALPVISIVDIVYDYFRFCV